jgi:hypothetical protein
MRASLKVFGFALLNLLVAHLVRADESAYLLDFRMTGSLATLFDSGLRPHSVSASPLEYKCVVRDKTLQILAPEEIRILVRTEEAIFDVANDDTLKKALILTRNLNAEQALQEALRLFQAFGGEPPGFREIFEKARKTRDFELLREVGRGTPIASEPSIGVGFVPGDFVDGEPQEFHVRISVSLYWRSNMVRKKLRKAPLVPPKGYEHESMAPELTLSEIRRRRDLGL